MSESEEGNVPKRNRSTTNNSANVATDEEEPSITVDSQLQTSVAVSDEQLGPSSSSRSPGSNNSDDGEPPAGFEKDFVPCAICKRKFWNHRIAKHEAICRKNSLRPKRPVWDSSKQRLKGTDAEPFAKNAKPVLRPKSNWKRNHEELIKLIRALRKNKGNANTI